MRSLIFVFVVFISGCATTGSQNAAHELRFEHQSKFTDMAALLERQTRNCWKREATPFNAGVKVGAKSLSASEARFTATREGLVGDPITGRTYKYSPFITISVIRIAENEVSISIVEKEYCPSFESCKDLKYRIEVKEWAEGNIACQIKIQGDIE